MTLPLLVGTRRHREDVQVARQRDRHRGAARRDLRKAHVDPGPPDVELLGAPDGSAGRGDRGAAASASSRENRTRATSRRSSPRRSPRSSTGPRPPRAPADDFERAFSRRELPDEIEEKRADSVLARGGSGRVLVAASGSPIRCARRGGRSPKERSPSTSRDPPRVVRDPNEKILGEGGRRPPPRPPFPARASGRGRREIVGESPRRRIVDGGGRLRLGRRPPSKLRPRRSRRRAPSAGGTAGRCRASGGCGRAARKPYRSQTSSCRLSIAARRTR